MRLVSPAGTVVECDGGLAEKLMRTGWSAESGKPDEKDAPKRKPGRPKKSE